MYYYHIWNDIWEETDYSPLQSASSLTEAIKKSRNLLLPMDGEWVGVIHKANSKKALEPRDIASREKKGKYPYLSKTIVGYVYLANEYNGKLYVYSPYRSGKAYQINKNGTLGKLIR